MYETSDHGETGGLAKALKFVILVIFLSLLTCGFLDKHFKLSVGFLILIICLVTSTSPEISKITMYLIWKIDIL